MSRIQEFANECREWWALISVKLAALVAAASGVFTANPELLVGLIGIIPVDPLLRLLFSVGVGAVVFLIPFIARLWPQDINIPKKTADKADGDGAL